MKVGRITFNSQTTSNGTSTAAPSGGAVLDKLYREKATAERHAAIVSALLEIIREMHDPFKWASPAKYWADKLAAILAEHGAPKS